MTTGRRGCGTGFLIKQIGLLRGPFLTRKGRIMGMDIRATIIVGIPKDEIYRREVKTVDRIKTDKNGVNYTVEEPQPVFYLLHEMYLENETNLYDVLDKKDLVEINDNIIGIEIARTRSHRSVVEAVVMPEDFFDKIKSAKEKFVSWGFRADIYLLQDISY